VVERDGNGKKKVSNKKKDGNGGERKENNGIERINANEKNLTMVKKGMTIM